METEWSSKRRDLSRTLKQLINADFDNVVGQVKAVLNPLQRALQCFRKESSVPWQSPQALAVFRGV